jgi:precorrin isomerase
VKYLLFGLSLWLCSYNTYALEQDEFNFLIDNIKQKNFNVVEAYLAEERVTATTDPDYAHLLSAP